MAAKPHIAVACGGTGGHIFPGLATAQALRKRGHHVTLWLAGKDMEHTAVHGWKGPVVTIASEGFQFGALRSILTIFRILKAIIRCWFGMLRHRPDVVLAMGSYASIGPCVAAMLWRIPYVLHEANTVPGRAVRLLARRASKLGICFEETRYFLKGSDVITTGMPLRPACHPTELRTLPKRFCLVVMGGSAGAHAINELVFEAMVLLGDSAPRIIHLAGRADADALQERYRTAGLSAKVHGFVQDMVPIYEDAHFMICRSGASSCAELGVFGVPALLIPYPFAASDHQTANAHSLEKVGAADVIQQADCTVEWLADYIRSQMEDAERLAAMRKSAFRADAFAAADKLAEVVEQCLQS